MLEQMVCEESTAFVFVFVWVEWSSRRFWGASECRKRWGSFVKCMKDLQERLPPPQIQKERDLSLSSLKLFSLLGSLFSIPTERPQKAGFPGYRGDFNRVGPPFGRSRFSLKEGKEKPSSAQTPCNRLSAALPGPDASKPPSPASSSSIRRSMVWLLGSESGLSRRPLRALEGRLGRRSPARARGAAVSRGRCGQGRAG